MAKVSKQSNDYKNYFETAPKLPSNTMCSATE